MSVILAGIIVAGLVPTPNIVGGGGAMMVLIIFLAVVFKATFEHLVSRYQKRKPRQDEDYAP